MKKLVVFSMLCIVFSCANSMQDISIIEEELVETLKEARSFPPGKEYRYYMDKAEELATKLGQKGPEAIPTIKKLMDSADTFIWFCGGIPAAISLPTELSINFLLDYLKDCSDNDKKWGIVASLACKEELSGTHGIYFPVYRLFVFDDDFKLRSIATHGVVRSNNLETRILLEESLKKELVIDCWEIDYLNVGHGHYKERTAAFYLTQYYGREALPILKEVIKATNNPIVQSDILCSLYEIGDEDSRDISLKMIKSSDDQVRKLAYQVLWKFSNPSQRGEIINELLTIQDIPALKGILKAIRDQSDEEPLIRRIYSLMLHNEEMYNKLVGELGRYVKWDGRIEYGGYTLFKLWCKNQGINGQDDQ